MKPTIKLKQLKSIGIMCDYSEALFVNGKQYLVKKTGCFLPIRKMDIDIILN